MSSAPHHTSRAKPGTREVTPRELFTNAAASLRFAPRMNKSRTGERRLAGKRSAASVRPENDSHVEDTRGHDECLNDEDPCTLEAGVVLEEGVRYIRESIFRGVA